MSDAGGAGHRPLPDSQPFPDGGGAPPISEGLTRLTLTLVSRVLEALEPMREMTDHGLATLGQGLAADRAVVIVRRCDDLGLVASQSSWRLDLVATHETGPATDGPDALPATWDRLSHGQTVAIGDVEALDESWDVDRRFLHGLGVRSAARAPIMSSGRTIGAVGVDMIGLPRRWTDDELTALRLIGAVLGGALSRARAEEQLHERDALFRALVANSSDVLVIVDSDGLALFVSPAVESMLGYRPDALLGHTFLELLHPDDLAPIAQRFLQVVESGVGGEPMVLRVRHTDGSWRWVEAIGRNLLADPAVKAILVNLREVTDRLEAEREIEAQRERYRQLLESIPDLVIRLDDRLRPVYGNPAAMRLQGRWIRGERPHAAGYHTQPELFDTGRTEMNTVLATGEPRSFEARLELDDGAHWFETSILPEFAEGDGKVTGLLTVSRDITAHKAREVELTRKALEDPLTGVANRSRFEAELDRVLHGLGRTDSPVGVLFLDLDDFKAVNDQLGHAIGDRFLAAFAERLSRAVRPSDLVARVGGDEFVVLPDRLRTPMELTELANRLHQALEQPMRLEGQERRVTVSIGIASATRPDAPSAAELLDRADRAMYRAKHHGPGQTEVWSPPP